MLLSQELYASKCLLILFLKCDDADGYDNDDDYDEYDDNDDDYYVYDYGSHDYRRMSYDTFSKEFKHYSSNKGFFSSIINDC